MNPARTFGREHVAGPDGVEWTIARQWLPRPPRWVGLAFGNLRRSERGEDAELWAPRVDGEPADDRGWWEGLGHLGDLAVPDADGPIGAILAVVLLAVLAVIVLAVLWIVVLPALVFAADLVLVLVLAGIAVVSRILFRRPWTIRATADEDTHAWAVVGWRASARAIRRISVGLKRGEPPERIPVPLL
ncbi:MAG: hypothetical protein WDA60_14355 [Acidimicrobiia bacterium]|jgi:hypothetical protein